MWKCSKCNYKNNNSSEKCHGFDCKAKKETDSFEKPVEIQKKKEAKKIYDFCPACKKDMFFTKTRWKGKTAWSCESGTHRPCDFTGKSKPFPLHLPQVNL